MPKIDVLNVEWVEIKTYAGGKHKFNSTTALKMFQSNRLGSGNYCFELDVPNELKDEGVSKVKVQAEFRKLYLYQKGWMAADKPKVYYTDASKLILQHELVQLKDYDGKPCIDNSDYRNDECRSKFIQSVSLRPLK
jgi:hypothetical protein